jgi:hypothetical protein
VSTHLLRFARLLLRKVISEGVEVGKGDERSLLPLNVRFVGIGVAVDAAFVVRPGVNLMNQFGP